MPNPGFDHSYGGNPAEIYERHFVRCIGAPLAAHLVQDARIEEGDRVLDVACGTGVVARLAAERAGTGGTVAGLDPNPGMLAVARSATPSGVSIEWHEASAEDMPLPDAAFDVVLCQMGLQFVPDKPAALHEMHRTLEGGGRLALNVPGPTPPLMQALADALAKHVAPQAAGFVGQVFGLHDPDEIERLVGEAGFAGASARADMRSLPLPEPREFLWSYVNGTPLAGVVAGLGEETRAALERDVVGRWEEFVRDGTLMLDLRVVTATAGKD